MVGSLDDPDLVSGPHIAFDDDAQVRARAHRLGEAARKHLIVHPHAEPPAGYPRLGNLENGAPDRPALPDEGAVHFESFRRQVFTKFTAFKGSADLPFPPPQVFDGIGVERFIGSPVGLAIRLLVAVEIHPSGGDPPGYGRFPNRTPGSATAVVELAHGTHADRDDISHAA